MGGTLLFRETRPGEYWPPVLPRGRFSAKLVGAKKILELLELTEEGLRCLGVIFFTNLLCEFKSPEIFSAGNDQHF